LRPLAQPGDVLIGFSGSGNSANIVKAMEWAKENNVSTIALGGRDGGKMKLLADVSIIAPTDSMAQLEDVHLMVTHMLFLSMMGDTRPALM
jgi:D-sedoheptulose 7-phosphate isomerase